MGSHRSKGRKKKRSRKRIKARQAQRANDTAPLVDYEDNWIPGLVVRLFGLFSMMLLVILGTYAQIATWWPGAGSVGRGVLVVCTLSSVVSTFLLSRLWLGGDVPGRLVGWSLLLCVPLLGPVLYIRRYRAPRGAPRMRSPSGPGIPDVWYGAGHTHDHSGDAGFDGSGGGGGADGGGGVDY